MNPKTQAEFEAACEHAQSLALQGIRRKKKSTWMVEYKGKQYFFTAEKI
jgi:hypothetical protein